MLPAVLDGCVRAVEVDRTVFRVMVMQLCFDMGDAMRQARGRRLQDAIPPSKALQRKAEQQQQADKSAHVEARR